MSHHPGPTTQRKSQSSIPLPPNLHKIGRLFRNLQREKSVVKGFSLGPVTGLYFFKYRPQTKPEGPKGVRFHEGKISALTLHLGLFTLGFNLV